MIHRLFLFMALAALCPTVASAEPVARTGSPLALVGVVPGTGQALIWEAQQGEYLLIRVGETCQGFQLRRLLPDRVILTKGSTSLALTLDSTPLVGPGEQRHETRDLPANIHTGSAARLPADAPAPSPPPSAQGAPSLGEPLAQAQEEAPPPPADRGAQVEEIPSPVRLGEGVQVISLLALRREVSTFIRGLSPYRVAFTASGGIRIRGIKTGSLLHNLGLEEGDELLSIGGLPLSSREQALNAYLTFAPDREVELQLLREGQPRTISFRLSA